MKNNFRILLAKNKLSVIDVHKKTGIAYSTLLRLKQESSNNPEIQTLIKLAKFFKIGLDDLIEIE